MSNIFEKRTSVKPVEYDVVKYRESVHESFWTHKHWKYTADISDFRDISGPERNVLKNALLAISQIEVGVKDFWGNIGKVLPKPEISQVGAVFSDNEVRHFDAYSKILTHLGLEDEFDLALENPAIKGRVEYLTKYLSNSGDNSQQRFTLTLTLFALFIENVSLFSQFAVVKSFNKHKNIFKDIDNVIQATQQEETIHALFGAKLIEYIKQENPEWFNEEFYKKVILACKKAYVAESNIIDWIFEEGDLDFVDAETIKEFIKQRFNYSMSLIGGSDVFEVDKDKLARLKWFEEELLTGIHNDFFNKRSTTYSINTQPITADDLWD